MNMDERNGCMDEHMEEQMDGRLHSTTGSLGVRNKELKAVGGWSRENVSHKCKYSVIIYPRLIIRVSVASYSPKAFSLSGQHCSDFY